MWEYFSASSWWRLKVRFFLARERKHIHTTVKELTHTHTITGGGVRKREKERDGKIARSRFFSCVKVCERARKGEEFCEQVCEWRREWEGRTRRKKGKGIIEFVWWNPEPKKVFFFGSDPNCGKRNKQKHQRVSKDKDQIPHPHTHHARTAQETPQQLLGGATNNNNSCCLSDEPNRWWRLLLLLRPCRWCHPSSRLIPHVTFSGVWTETIIGRGVNILCVCEIDACEFVWVFLL